MHGKQGECLLRLRANHTPSATSCVGNANQCRVPDHAEKTALLATSLTIPTSSWRFTRTAKPCILFIRRRLACEYKTIVLELLKQQTELHEQLRITRRLLPTMEDWAKELKPATKPGRKPSFRRSRRATPSRSAAKQWRSLSRNWRIVCPPRVLRTRTQRSTKRWHTCEVTRRASKRVTATAAPLSTQFQITRCRRHPRPAGSIHPMLLPEPSIPGRSRPDAVRYFCQRRKGKSPRHPRRHPHAEGHRASSRQATPEKDRHLPDSRVRSRRLLDFPRSGQR